MFYKSKALAPFVQCKLDKWLFPIHPWDKTGSHKGKPKQLGKTPVYKGWSKNKTSKAKLQKHIDKGGNVGLAIPPGWFVIDMDPRNYMDGVDPGDVQDQVAEMLGLFDWEEIEWEYNLARTGGGGYHIYGQLPDETIYRRLRTKLKGLPGVDIKKHGGYVVAAGSKHPNGEYYQWLSELSPESTVKLVGSALEPLLKPEPKGSTDESYGCMNGSELYSAVLRHLEASHFHSDELWFPLMCACHFVTAGNGVDEFVEWSATDPEFANDSEKVRYRWESLDDRRSDANTAGTLFHALRERGECTNELSGLVGRNDFAGLDEEIDMNSDEFLDRASESISELIIDELDTEDGLLTPMAYVTSMPLDSENITSEMIQKAARLIATRKGDFEAIRARNLLMEKSGLKKAELNEITRVAMEKRSNDMAVFLRDKTLEGTFNGGKHLFFYNEMFYAFNGKCWQEMEDAYLGRIIERTLHKLKDKVEFQASDISLIRDATSLAKICRAQRDGRKLTGDPAPIINCDDVELHINGGNIECRPHSPASNQFSVLKCQYGSEPLDYDYEKMCPLFMQTIREIFAEYPDTDDIVRHVGELFGYLLQPEKDIASAWLLRGPGGDGKSTLLKILAALMGKSYYAASQSILSCYGTESHATSALPGKLALVIEELSDNMKLQEVAIKMFSEGVEMAANPKGRKPYNFSYCGSLVMCANSWPRIGDISEGMRRRLNVIPFNRRFNANGTADAGRANRILRNPGELGGVLRFALHGLARLRARGHFQSPESCVVAKQEWLKESNNTLRYAMNCLDEHDGKPLHTLIECYEHYCEWARNDYIEEKYILNQKSFKEKMASLGVIFKRSQHGGGNITRCFSHKIKEEHSMAAMATRDFDGVAD